MKEIDSRVVKIGINYFRLLSASIIGMISQPTFT